MSKEVHKGFQCGYALSESSIINGSNTNETSETLKDGDQVVPMEGKSSSLPTSQKNITMNVPISMVHSYFNFSRKSGMFINAYSLALHIFQRILLNEIVKNHPQYPVSSSKIITKITKFPKKTDDIHNYCHDIRMNPNSQHLSFILNIEFCDGDLHSLKQWLDQKHIYLKLSALKCSVLNDVGCIAGISPKEIHNHLIQKELQDRVGPKVPFQIHSQKIRLSKLKVSTVAYAIE